MIVALLQARTGSSRLPGKVLADIHGAPMLLRQIERVRRARAIDRLVVATSDDASDDALAALCAENGVACHRGSLDDVLARMIGALDQVDPDNEAELVVRLTGDCPLADPAVIDRVIGAARESAVDFASNVINPTYPDGLDVEVTTGRALRTAAREATRISDREHVMPFISRQPERFTAVSVERETDLSAMRWTVDEPEDLIFVREVYDRLYPTDPAFGMEQVLALLAREPDLAAINQAYLRNEGYARSLEQETMSQSQSKRRFTQSELLLDRAERTIPLGSQTFSKSRTQYPRGISPYFITHADGARVWDADGNEYVDFINSQCSVTLGYNDPDVTAAVREQLESGVIFSLPHPIEMEVAERIVEMVPCAEKVRFGKNGSDATAGAIRIARAFTGRDRVAVCGYHGWQDWYIGSTARNLGVPQATRDLTSTFTFNDPASLKAALDAHPGEFAAVILEPMNVTYPTPEFLGAVKELAHAHGALLVFDETITGFRCANGGAQEMFGVTPDLATFGKGLANGYPVSAVTGRADVMKLMEEVFFSFTFGGETLSLAAAKATLDKLRGGPVLANMRKTGEQAIAGIEALIAKHGLAHMLSVSGDATWSFLNFKDTANYTLWELKTLYMQEIFERGVLAYGTQNISAAHGPDEIAALLAAYDGAFAALAEADANRTLAQVLRCKPLEPLFKVR
jgi:glutamate-1-semialdehyde aminotransferase/spore coat polysaccharide biosynthesis protein SpsF (cytidylyltransferase family)